MGACEEGNKEEWHRRRVETVSAIDTIESGSDEPEEGSWTSSAIGIVGGVLTLVSAFAIFKLRSS